MSWDRVERLLGQDVLKYLHQQTVGVVGLGSGGSFVALSLAMSGVGGFVLIDDDVVAETNIVRHAADRRYLGHPKVDAVADLIRHRNPEAVVQAIQGRLEEHIDALDSASIVICGVDSEAPKYTLNEIALERGLTVVYAGVYERGEGGDICLIRPESSRGPCYACWAEHLREGLVQAPAGSSEELDYGMIGPDGTLAAEPGLWLHVVRIAAAQADLALNELLRDTDMYQEMPANTLIMANRHLEIYEQTITPPYGAEWVNVPRNPDCLVCGDRHQDEAHQTDLSLKDLADLGAISVEEQDD